MKAIIPFTLALGKLALVLALPAFSVSTDLVRRDGINWHGQEPDTVGEKNTCSNINSENLSDTPWPLVGDCQKLISALQSNGGQFEVNDGFTGGWQNLVSYDTCNFYVDTDGFPSATTSGTVPIGTDNIIDIVQTLLKNAPSIGSGLAILNIIDAELPVPPIKGTMNCQTWVPGIQWKLQGN